MEGQDAISLEVYKERGLPNEGMEKKNEENENRTRTMIERARERERENKVHPCTRTLSLGKIVKNHLYT